MSRPAQRYIHQRTVACPVCQASVGRPCQAYTDAEIDRAMETNAWTVKPHPERLRLERIHAEEKD